MICSLSLPMGPNSLSPRDWRIQGVRSALFYLSRAANPGNLAETELDCPSLAISLIIDSSQGNFEKQPFVSSARRLCCRGPRRMARKGASATTDLRPSAATDGCDSELPPDRRQPSLLPPFAFSRSARARTPLPSALRASPVHPMPQRGPPTIRARPSPPSQQRSDAAAQI
jgi:hypothetical protein